VPQSAGDDDKIIIVPFLHGLKEKTGYIVGQNVPLEYRWAENQIGVSCQRSQPIPSAAAGMTKSCTRWVRRSHSQPFP
jgi:hypothetical protein